MKRAWTEGPWRVLDPDGYGWEVATADADESGAGDVQHVAWSRGESYRDTGRDNEATMRLIALAPEMAEAILAWDDNGQCAPPDSDALVNLAAKLREIGGE